MKPCLVLYKYIVLYMPTMYVYVSYDWNLRFTSGILVSKLRGIGVTSESESTARVY